MAEPSTSRDSHSSTKGAQDPWAVLPDQYAMVLSPGYWDSLRENLVRLSDGMASSPNWFAFLAALKDLSYSYRQDTQEDLLVGGLPVFVYKSTDSIKKKLLRDFYKEGQWSGEPFITTSGILIPNIGDLIRTRFVVNYLDGVVRLSTSMRDFFQNRGVLFNHKHKGEKEGYFAHHVIYSEQLLFYFMGHSSLESLKVEVQIATPSATRWWSFSHILYESDREMDKSLDWQWDVADPRFVCNHLGHVLHLSEGLFVQMRNQLRSKK